MSPDRGREAAIGRMIESLTAGAGHGERAALIALPQDVVDGGASVGFLPPLSAAEAGEYWDGVFDPSTGARGSSGSPGRRARASPARCSSTSRSAPTAITG